MYPRGPHAAAQFGTPLDRTRYVEQED